MSKLSKGLLFVLLLALPSTFVIGQIRPYHQVAADCVTGDDSVTVGFGFDCWYVTFKLADPTGNGGGTATVKRFMNGTAIETTGIVLGTDDSFTSRVQCDSIFAILTNVSDYFCYEAAR